VERLADGRPVIKLAEYQSVTVERVTPSPSDESLTLDAELCRRLTIHWGRGDLMTVTAQSYVGVVDLDCARIVITPKVGPLHVLGMLEYAYGGSKLNYLSATRNLPVGGLHLRDFLCALLVEECERLVRSGLRRDYVRRTGSEPAVRGRLLVDRQVLRRFGRLDQLECRYDEFDGDILDNQLCAAALDVSTRTASDETRRRSQRCGAVFRAICDPTTFDRYGVMDRITYNRLNEPYRAAHRWALLLLNSGGLGNLFASSPWRGRAFFIDMNQLFEKFVTRLLQDAASGTGITVQSQDGHDGIIRDEKTLRAYAEVRPDVLIRGSDWQMPVDAKYKLYDDHKISNADIYQVFLYAYALSSTQSPTGVIVYPATSADNLGSPVRVAVMDGDGSVGARVVAVSLDVTAILDALGSPTYNVVAREALEGLLACGGVSWPGDLEAISGQRR
jgi:5-methylcytosine-specific restriction enzyme subunit McrC